MAMPRLAGGTTSTVRSSISTCPAVCSSSPAMTRSNVDLPQPEGPTNTTNSPSEMSRSTPLMASKSPNDLRTLCSFNDPTSGSSLQIDCPAFAHAAIGRQHDLERIHAIRHVLRQIDVLADGLQHIGLLAVAQRLVARLVGHRDLAVGPHILAVAVQLRPMR